MDQSLNENLYGGEEIIGASQHDQARSWFGRIAENIRKIQIEGHENTAFQYGVIVQIWIDCSVKTLLSNG
jgi:hypothetical protein